MGERTNNLNVKLNTKNTAWNQAARTDWLAHTIKKYLCAQILWFVIRSSCHYHLYHCSPAPDRRVLAWLSQQNLSLKDENSIRRAGLRRWLWSPGWLCVVTPDNAALSLSLTSRREFCLVFQLTQETRCGATCLLSCWTPPRLAPWGTSVKFWCFFTLSTSRTKTKTCVVYL